jgi:hypothetical protein
MTRPSTHRLNALYYPYADVTHSEQLLLASIYFDNIYILEPNFFYPPSSSPHLRVPSSESMRPLITSGVVKPIGPDLLGLSRHFGPRHPVLDEDNIEILLNSITEDLQNEALKALTRDSGFTWWSIPTGQQLFWNGLGLLLSASKEGKGSRVQILTDRVDYYRGVLSSGGYQNVPVVGRTEYRVRTQLDGSDLEVYVPFLEAESLMVNIALLACSELNLCPITDARLHHQFLCSKLADPGTQQLVLDCRKALSLPLRESEVAMHTIKVNLPKLEGLTAEKVLRIRDKCGDSLERYRLYMGKLKHSLENEVWTDDFAAEVQKVLDTEISPAVRDLSDLLKTRAGEFGVKLLEDATKLTPLPLLVSLATGLPIEWMLGASAGLVFLKNFIENQVKRGTIKNNGLFFLLDIASR